MEARKHRQMVHLNVCVCITCLCCSAEPPPSGPLVSLIRLSSPVGPVGPDGGEFIVCLFFLMHQSELREILGYFQYLECGELVLYMSSEGLMDPRHGVGRLLPEMQQSGLS